MVDPAGRVALLVPIGFAATGDLRVGGRFSMRIEFEVSDIIPAAPQAVYAAWLDSDQHSKMTGSPARVSSRVGDTFEAWDGYIEGTNLELEPNSRILQRWRTSEFADSDEDSLLEVTFELEGSGTRVTVRHSELPQHGMQYRQGWVDAYFAPMQRYFGGRSAENTS